MLKRLSHKDNGSYILTTRGDKVKIASEKNADHASENDINDLLFDQKLEAVTEGLEYYHLKHLRPKISAVNALTIAKHIPAMKTETNISDSRRRSIITSLKLLSEFLKNKPFERMTREDVISYLNMLRRQESEEKTRIRRPNAQMDRQLQSEAWLFH